MQKPLKSPPFSPPFFSLSMAEEASPPPHPPRRQQRKKKKKSAKLTKDGPADSDRLESLRWNESLPSDDPFVLLAGSNEGGFLSLDEIEEADYGFVEGIPDPIGGAKKKEKKRKRVDGDGGGGGEDGDVKGNKKKKKKRKNRSQKTKEKADPEKNVAEENKDGFVEGKVEDVQNDTNGGDLKGDNDNELILGEDEVYAWNELRLHPLLIKSIRRLGFKEPTPIQRACIPAAAHQGKDVIGAAETGSGKTLAFGLPILQRLLEEREKVARLTRDNSNPNIRGGLLRALVVTPTRELALQVSDHLKKAAKFLDILVVPIVGGMSSEKQERLLKRRPEIIVGTPGRLWELMSAGDQHLGELHSLSFFVLDEADRMIEHGHFHELQSIIDMLPVINGCVEQSSQSTPTCKTVPNLQRKKRQTFVFSATIALSDNFRKKLKRGLSIPKSSMSDNLSSIEALSERAGMKPDAAIFDLTNASIVANKLEESFIDCSEEDKDAYLYYILSVHGQGRTIVFCTSIAALRHISSILRILGVNAWTLHAQMQQRARLKAIDRFRGNENTVLVATDVAARGLDIPHVRTVVHYQLPHSAEVYIHRSGRTARASADGCCIALISPSDKTKFFSLCKSLSRESLRQFPIDDAYMPEVTKRLSLAHQIDKIMRKNSQENSKNNWFKRNAESVELAMDVSDNEEERVKDSKEKKTTSAHLKKLQQELNDHIAHPMQPKSFSRRFFAGAGVTPILQQQLEELSKKSAVGKLNLREKKGSGFVVIGQDCIEPLQALRSSGHEVCFNVEKKREMQRQAETWKRKKREEKKNSREQKRKKKRKAKEGMK